MNDNQYANIMIVLRRIAEALETIAKKADPEFKSSEDEARERRRPQQSEAPDTGEEGS